MMNLVPLPVLASVKGVSFPDRRISFFNTHTGESLDAAYCIKGRYCPEALSAINHILRDHYTEDIYRIDVRLLDQLFALSRKLDTGKPFHVISGYRSVATNKKLRKSNSGVVKNSYHMKGQAIDIRLPGVRLFHLKKTALRLNSGGVGYYPRSDFVHLDSGPVRSW